MPENSLTVPYRDATSYVGSGIPAVAGAIADATRSAWCNLYEKAPGFATGEMFGNPIAPYNDGLLDAMCRPLNKLPPQRSKPFNGGQCTCDFYTMNWRLTGASFPGGVNGDSLVQAPVQSPITVTRVNSNGDTVVDIYVPNGGGVCGAVRRADITGNASPDSRVQILSVVRQGGLPDNCGELAPTYPRYQPPLADIDFNANLQVTPVFNINAPVRIFAPITNLRPQLKIGDFNTTLDLGGITIDLSPNINPGNQLPGTPPTQQPAPGDNQDENDPVEQNDEILKYLKRLRECQECELDYDFLATGAVSGTSGSITVPAGGIPLTVGLTITKQPTNAKRENGLTEPNVLYAGWGWFSGNGFLATRQPMDCATKLFYAPSKPSTQKFSFTLRVGYEGTAIMAYKRRKNPLPPV